MLAIRLAWRSLWKNRLFTAINLTGLALGISCSLIIWMWVKDELRYDAFYPEKEDLYLVRPVTNRQGDIQTGFMTPGPLLPAIQKDIPEAAYVARIGYAPPLLVSAGPVAQKEDGFYVTDDFFGVFRLPALAGDPAKALTAPGTIVISRKLAEKYFGTWNAVGRRLNLDRKTDYLVGAVVENVPMHSSIRFDWVVNFRVQEQEWMKRWGNTSFRTYVRLRPDAERALVARKLRSVFSRNGGDGDTYALLQPVSDLYLYGKYEKDIPTGGRITYVRIFSLVAVFILLIACINFMNLATARSGQRAREIGVRKAIGATRFTLIRQFLSESVLTSALAAVIALLLADLSLPTFNNLFHKDLTFDLVSTENLLTFAGIVVVTGVLAGSYPALFLSSLLPARVLKGTFTVGKRTLSFRKSLVVFQFAISTFLLIGVAVVSRQMSYIQHQPPGYDKAHLVYVPLENQTYDKLETYRQEILRSPDVVAASPTQALLMNIESYSGDLEWPGRKPGREVLVSAACTGADFARTAGIPLVAGRDFSTAPGDSNAYLINESAARLMGMKDAVGQQVSFWNGKGPVVGVMKDFHLQSFHSPIKPLILVRLPENSSYLFVRIQPGKTREALAHIQAVTKRFNPDYPADYHFVDEEFGRMYESELQVHMLVRYFGGMAIFISCLGLFALAAFSTEQRTKEIGIRKVMGAGVGQIVLLLSGDFLRLVFFALVLAVPAAWWTFSRWLETFQYRVPLDGWIVFAGCFAALSIAFVTVSSHTLRAARVNPVKSLKSE
ncbi:ABC transporter permease [Siphonobacter aquaeclarae]|uniref:Duplicated orphan permease n=1 Tax=Siphonobacter aquaeclarae TaxID=563176 RepID=A0A1G9PGI7_9BACT|nr:ABC transporter permease [Siphonobacter aquaeclarae]SDL97982.1 duplicated orphan permease [Siphonobacter aquaeclarae]